MVTILTIGHSTHPIETFLEMLQAHDVERVVDVRTIPRSRRNPQFNSDVLPTCLNAVGIQYTHLPGLGGLRRPKPDSINQGWENEGFRGFADYMHTPAFEQNLNRLIELAQVDPLTLMCAEAVPWRCHRSLIADALLVRGIEVEDILSRTRRQAHKLTDFAVVDGTSIVYPAATEP